MGEHVMAALNEKALDEAVIVALGGNLKGSYGSVENLLEAALEAFAAEGLKVIARSSWWRSAAWPDPVEPEYRNGIALVETALDPDAVLTALQRIERRFGRERGKRNAPRTLDLDLIAFGRLVRADADPIVPHPRAAERRFVMGPLAEIAPGWLHPVTGETAQALAAGARVGADAAPA